MSSHFHGFLEDFLLKASKSPDRVFARYEGEPITFGAIDAMSSALAAYLDERGVRHGDRVAVMMRNSPLSLPVLFGLARAGIAWVPVNVQQRGEGLRYILEHSEPKAVICDNDLVALIEESGATYPEQALILTAGADSLAGIMLAARAFAGALPRADDVFATMYTSGTTGRPKGVLVTHGMLRLAGEGVRHLTAPRPGDVFFLWEPLYHIGGAQTIILPIVEDVCLAMVERFSASRFWEQVLQYGATHIHYLGGILQLLLKQPETPADRDHPVRVAWGGGCPKEIWPRVRKRFGMDIRECYGMTEASSITTCNVGGPVGSVGTPLPWFSVDIIGQNGEAVPRGDRGEIVMRTSVEGAFFKGYLHNPEATERTLRNGGLHTGDCGSIDAEGNLWFHGRLNDSIRVKGENISAWEVEHIAGAHPAVEDCAIIGVQAEFGESDIKLFVKPKNGRDVDPAELSQWLSSRLARYQLPRYIAVIDEFERTPSQRIMKHKLSKALDDCWVRA